MSLLGRVYRDFTEPDKKTPVEYIYVEYVLGPVLLGVLDMFRSNKISIVLNTLVCVGLLFSSSCTGEPEVLPPQAEDNTSATLHGDNLDAVAGGMNQFACNLYKRLADDPCNLFFSPYSISSALAMTYAGARGDTEEQMAEVLGFLLPQEKLHAAFSSLKGRLAAPAVEGRRLDIANALWAERDFGFLPAYIELTKKYYDAGLYEVNFLQEAEKVRLRINAWVEEQTNNKIKDLLPVGVLDVMTRLVLTNAIYFKGDWEVQFKPENTKLSPFHLGPNRQIEVSMMYRQGEFGYGEFDGTQVLELGYAGGDLSMVVLLPEKVGLADLEVSLTAELLGDWLGRLEKRKVMVFLPKFKQTSEFSLGGVLSKMGMPDAFCGRADFSGMTGRADLHISAVLHKAFVEVNEQGTEAAAATGVIMRTTAAGPNTVPVFRADRPFIFLIREVTTGGILFMGRLVRPAEVL